MPENTTTPSEESKEVTTPAEITAPAASAETKADDTQALIDKLSTEAQTALRIADEKTAALDKAEKKIVDLKRTAKEKNVDLEDEVQPLDPEAIAERAAAIAAAKIAAQNIDNGSELATARTTINELTESLKARTTVAQSGTGTNQDRYEPETEVKLSPLERQLMERRASAAGVTLKEYLKAHPIS